MKTGDIMGAQANTLKKGITTTRFINPIWPHNHYQYPGLSNFFKQIKKLIY
jgi:hypothetical protein